MKKMEDIVLGHRIKNLRISLGMNQKQFSDSLQTKVSTLSNWENGRNKPNMEKLSKIAELANISIEELLYGTNEERLTILLSATLQEYDEYTQLDFMTIFERIKKNLPFGFLSDYTLNKMILNEFAKEIPDFKYHGDDSLKYSKDYFIFNIDTMKEIAGILYDNFEDLKDAYLDDEEFMQSVREFKQDIEKINNSLNSLEENN